eukprot:TRINITY_DN11469_c0_g1_i1.p1 TRINITY_DN11469_c0_g1~~TRINITY_DN11469_c0_g1_i1.p1  ORF type:complete len:122 (+),score=18.93 TRINITY_DN11469_c0_g1_i1:98-463(+)
MAISSQPGWRPHQTKNRELHNGICTGRFCFCQLVKGAFELCFDSGANRWKSLGLSQEVQPGGALPLSFILLGPSGNNEANKQATLALNDQTPLPQPLVSSDLIRQAGKSFLRDLETSTDGL